MRVLVMLLGVSLAAQALADDTARAFSDAFGRLFPSQQTECPEGLASNCVCGEIGNRTSLPMRYARVQSCPHPVFDDVDRVRTFTADGAPVDDIMLKNGRLHGAAISRHPNGQVEGIANYDEGRQIGFARVWHDNGRLAAEQRFVDGEPDGTEVRYTRDGAVEFVVVWNRGEPDREATRRLSRSLGVTAPFDRERNDDTPGQ